ncbi:hypothetical protein ATANTOWER_025378, partial [Ataeniobius toweri]|nr:hypothetical protein [Ataeniobius toweri]
VWTGALGVPQSVNWSRSSEADKGPDTAAAHSGSVSPPICDSLKQTEAHVDGTLLPGPKTFELPQKNVPQEEVLADQEKTCSLDQEEPEPTQIKEEWVEVQISDDVWQVVLKQEVESLRADGSNRNQLHSLKLLTMRALKTRSSRMNQERRSVGVSEEILGSMWGAAS